MHSLARRYLKTGIFFLVAGLALGLYALLRREAGGSWPSRYIASAHAHVILVGFVMFMILGVGLWIFPRPRKEDVRYRPGLAELAYWLLTVGTAARFVGEILRAGASDVWLRWMVMGGGVGQAVGLVVYFWTMWTRIRPVGSRVREELGEKF